MQCRVCNPPTAYNIFLISIFASTVLHEHKLGEGMDSVYTSRFLAQKIPDEMDRIGSTIWQEHRTYLWLWMAWGRVCCACEGHRGRTTGRVFTNNRLFAVESKGDWAGAVT